MTRVALAMLVFAGCFARHGSSPACPEGRTVNLDLPDDVKRLAGCERVGGIVIRTGADIDLAPLAQLEEVTGDVTVGPTVAVDTVAFNGLVHVGGTIRVANNGALRGLFFPRLERAGRIEVDNNAVLSTISMPRLVRVDGSLVITDNTEIELVTLNALETVGHDLVIASQPRLGLLQMPKLARTETIRLERLPHVPAEVIDQLTSKATVPRSGANP